MAGEIAMMIRISSRLACCEGRECQHVQAESHVPGRDSTRLGKKEKCEPGRSEFVCVEEVTS